MTIEGLKNNIRIYAGQSGAKGPLPNASKYVDQSYLKDSLKEIDKN